MISSFYDSADFSFQRSRKKSVGLLVIFSRCDVIDLLVTSEVKSQMAPHLKIILTIGLLTVESFMPLGESAHFTRYLS